MRRFSFSRGEDVVENLWCRYSRSADWEYITECAKQTPSLPLIGNGDVFSWRDYQDHVNGSSPVATTMIAR